MLPSATVNGSAGAEGSGSAGVLTDGAAPGGNVNTYAMGNNGSLTYTLGSAPLGYEISGVNVYSGWNDTGRDRITVSLAYSTYDAPDTFTAIAGSSVNYDGGSGVAVARYSATGDGIAVGASKLRFDFGSQENNYAGYRELEVVGRESVSRHVTLANAPASSVMAQAAHLNASLSCSGAVYQVTAYWGPTNGGTNAAAWAKNATAGSYTNLISPTAISRAATGLLPGTTNYFTFQAVNISDMLWAEPSQSFMTSNAMAETTFFMFR